MSFVLDNSVTMCWFFGMVNLMTLIYAEKILDAMKMDSAHVSATWGREVSNMIARAGAKGLVTEARSNAFFEILGGVDAKVDTTIFAHALSYTLQLARRCCKLSSYDASYLELALRLGMPLVTLSEGLQKTAKKAGVKKWA